MTMPMPHRQGTFGLDFRVGLEPGVPRWQNSIPGNGEVSAQLGGMKMFLIWGSREKRG